MKQMACGRDRLVCCRRVANWFGLYILCGSAVISVGFCRLCLVWFGVTAPHCDSMARLFLALGGAAIVAAMPLLLYFAHYPIFVFRTAYVANRGLGAVEDSHAPDVAEQHRPNRARFFWQGETICDIICRQTLSRCIAGALFITGMAVTATKTSLRRQCQGLFLFLWLIVMLLATILSGDAPHFRPNDRRCTSRHYSYRCRCCMGAR